jgi:hypothetical protein
MVNVADLAPSAESFRVDFNEIQSPWPDNPTSSETKIDVTVDNSVELWPICGHILCPQGNLRKHLMGNRVSISLLTLPFVL